MTHGKLLEVPKGQTIDLLETVKNVEVGKEIMHKQKRWKAFQVFTKWETELYNNKNIFIIFKLVSN